MSFYTRTLRIPRVRFREIAVFSVGVYVARAITSPPNPPPDPPCLLTALDIIHRHVQKDKQ